MKVRESFFCNVEKDKRAVHAAAFHGEMLRRSRSLFRIALAVTVGLIAPRAADAQVATFAQFFQNTGGNPFSYTSTGTAGSGGSALFGVNSLAIDFKYFSILGLPADLSGFQSAHLTFTSFTTLGPTVSSNGFDEIFNGSGVNSAMITITRDAPAAEGSGSRTILLQAIFTPYTFSGSGGSGGFSASSLSGTVNFTSDFLDFSSSVQRDVGLSFSSIIPGLNIGPNGFFIDFTAAGTGTFSSSPMPIFVPEPTTCAFLAAGATFVLLGFARRRRAKSPLGT